MQGRTAKKNLAAVKDGSRSRAPSLHGGGSSGVRRAYGRGTGIPHPVDVEVGARIRQRRLLLGMNQETLATRLGLTFQQIQKYEGGGNRVSASRLKETADALDTTISYFFEGISAAPLTAEEQQHRDLMRQPETIDLVRFYYAMPDEHVRKQFLELVKSIAASKGVPVTDLTVR